MVRGAVGDEAIAMTEMALQYVTALHADVTALRQMAAARCAEKQRMQLGAGRNPLLRNA
jgi:hypothetical protein